MTNAVSRIPDPPGEEEIHLHTRDYSVKTYRISDEAVRIRGRVTDTKPPGLYIADDPDPLSVHDMVVDLIVSYPALVIEGVDVVLDTHPHESCPSIEASYQKLIGTSISRGFGRQLTTLFGGPNGCTHVGALLRAMAPVVVQSMYSMQFAAPGDYDPWDPANRTQQDDERANKFVADSCHVWASDGEMMNSRAQGEPFEVPIWLTERREKLGRS